MSQNLVIVESPAKAKTIKKYLGKDFEVLASYGHVRDLIPKEGAVDVAHGFTMKYDIIREKNKEKHVDAILKAAKKAQVLYLATDPDREGEAISWHINEILQGAGLLDGKREVHRAVFYEITKKEVQQAIAHPRQISGDLVNAQQARRALDYLVGFNLSPLLWKKVMPGLSAGRVQSVALRLLCDREAEINAFTKREYWTIEVDAQQAGLPFKARLAEYRGQKVEVDTEKERFSFTSEAEAREVEATLQAAASGALRVTSVEKKPRRRNPQPPFRTSTLQQAGSNRLGYSARKTMQMAQKLYEGQDFGEGPVGLITYMRTDSVSLADEAIAGIRETIVELYGRDGLSDEPRQFKTTQANAQEAHEGIRPTNAALTPEKLKGLIDPDMWRLYDLIWKRTVASQMAPALFEEMAVDLVPAKDPGVARLRASGSTLLKPGFLRAYEDDRNDDAEEAGSRLPPLAEGDRPQLDAIRPEQHFTQPPPRYTEASLVKALEERGIGRPSTYASIIDTLVARKYTELESRRFTPTDTGKIVCNFLVQFFPSYVDYDFTANLEGDLDQISRGEKEWVPVLEHFWAPFIKQVKDVEKNVSREQVAMSRPLGIDPKSGKPVSVRMGQYGPFAQIGTKDDEEKPKFASLRPGQKMDTIELEDALALFALPRALGAFPDNGEPMTVAIGRFGPYIKYGAAYVSLKTDDPYTVSAERAVEVIREKLAADAARTILAWPEAGIEVLNGRFGPYITDGAKNGKVPKDRQPHTMTLDECKAILAVAPPKGQGRFGRFAKKKGAAAANDAAPAAEAKPVKVAAKKAAKKTAAKVEGEAAPKAAAKPAAKKKAPAKKKATKNT
jgi:DNA topoisomerase I